MKSIIDLVGGRDSLFVKLVIYVRVCTKWEAHPNNYSIEFCFFEQGMSNVCERCSCE